MLTVFPDSFVFLTLISMSFFQGECSRSRENCTLDTNMVLNESDTEVTVTVNNAFTNNDDDGYFGLVFSEGRFKDLGRIKAWCIDIERTIGFQEYKVDIFSSLQPELFTKDYPEAVDEPEHVPAINWLINNYSSGTTVADTVSNCIIGGVHNITDREFQLAVWSLVDDVSGVIPVNPGEYKQCVVDFLVSQAMEHKDYVPDCTNPLELIGLIVIVDDEEREIKNQVLIMEVLLSDTRLCDCDKLDPRTEGDPHFKTWAGDHYDFHGVCDLVWMKNPEFGNGLGMDIHIRTARMGMWSYISNAAIRIGEDIFEIVGGQVEKNIWINGVAGEPTEISNVASTLSGFPIYFKQMSNNQREFVIDLGESQLIILKSWKSFVSIEVKNPEHKDFKNSVGLVGSFPQGTKIARDNISVVDEMDTFGQEWQVLASEKNVFHNIVGPQHPEHCDIPSHSEMRRRLGDSIVTTEQAKKACASVNKDAMDLCIFDVMATNDKLTVGAY